MLDAIFNLIEKHDSIVIFGHIHPDGDCYGSQIGLREVLKLAYPNKKIYAVGSGYHRFHQRIGDMDIVSDEVIKESLAIILDSNDLPRIEDQRVCTAKAWAKIDHHIDTGFFTEGPQLVDERANSTCEMITQIVMERKMKINKNAAEALFLGIMTDTGRFQFTYDYCQTFQEASWLCEQGANPDILNKILNITYEPLLAFKGYIYSHYIKTEAGVIYVVLDRATLKKYKMSASKAGSMVNLLSSVYGYPIWAFFCENEDGTNHAEFRSNGPVVQPVAALHGGGGHLHAAGVTLKDSSDELIQTVVRELDQSIREYKENKKCGKTN